jgi:hypothetical protein
MHPTPAGRGRPRGDEPPLALARAHLDSAVHRLAALVRHGNRREQQCAIERRVEFSTSGVRVCASGG